MSRYLIWERSLDPQETVDYSINWSNDLGDRYHQHVDLDIRREQRGCCLGQEHSNQDQHHHHDLAECRHQRRSLRHTEHHRHGRGSRTFERTAKITVRNS